jgi:hypothetical protein
MDWMKIMENNRTQFLLGIYVGAALFALIISSFLFIKQISEQRLHEECLTFSDNTQTCKMVPDHNICYQTPESNPTNYWSPHITYEQCLERNGAWQLE